MSVRKDSIYVCTSSERYTPYSLARKIDAVVAGSVFVRIITECVESGDFSSLAEKIRAKAEKLSSSEL